MSSKRNLYKPAPAAQTPPQASRRSLAQGRLTLTDPKLLLSDVSPRASDARPSPSKRATPQSHAKRSLRYSSAMTSTNNPNAPSHQISPTITHSPAKVQPSASLSLSETEDEPRKPQVEVLKPPAFFEQSVLAVDASDRQSGRADNEVPIKTSYIKSPAKVVCHSPKRTATSEITGSPHHGHAGKISIPVETVPSVNVFPVSQPHRHESQSTCSPPPSEDSSLSTVAGSPVDRRSKAVETVVVQERNNPRSYVSFLDDGSDTSVPCSNVQQLNLDQSEVHVGQPKFDDTGISNTVGSSRMDSGIEEVKRKKKKKTRVVPSKYMTSAMSRTGDKPPNVKRSENQSSRNAASTKTTSLAKGRKARMVNAPKPMVKEYGNESIVTNVKKPLFTSTPAEALHHVVMTTEDSKSNAAQKTDGSLPTGIPGKDKDRMKTTKDLLPGKDGKPERNTQVRFGKQTGGEVSQLQLDLQHARLCQWRFLRLKARDAFKKQEKSAQKWFYSMSQLNEQLSERNHELRLKLAKKKKEEEIDRQLELQLSVLRTLDAQTRRLFPDYDKFYEGIDATRHHLPVKDIVVPQNEDELLEALDELENNAQEILDLFQNDESKILLFSDEMRALADTVQAETEEHERCTELLAAANSLVTQEQSLQAGLIELTER